MGCDNSAHVLVQHCCHFTEVQAEMHEANLPDKLMLIILFIFNPLNSRVFCVPGHCHIEGLKTWLLIL